MREREREREGEAEDVTFSNPASEIKQHHFLWIPFIVKCWEREVLIYGLWNIRKERREKGR